MTVNWYSAGRAGLLLSLLLGTTAGVLVAQNNTDQNNNEARKSAAPSEKKPSSYAPAKDLESQVEQYLGSIDEDLSNETEYGEEQQIRIVQNANTLAAILLVLGLHDDDNKLKKAAPAGIAASVSLADEASDFQQARQALGKLKTALKSEGGGELEWEPVADLQQLMKQVPIVNNNLRRGVTGRRFDRLTDQNAAVAATLAALAQASLVDTTYCSDKEDTARWEKYCAAMRDSAAAVNIAVRKGDKDSAVAALAGIVKTCDDCHHDFRD